MSGNTYENGYFKNILRPFKKFYKIVSTIAFLHRIKSKFSNSFNSFNKISIYLLALLSSISLYAMCYQFLIQFQMSSYLITSLSIIYSTVYFMMFANVYDDLFNQSSFSYFFKSRSFILSIMLYAISFISPFKSILQISSAYFAILSFYKDFNHSLNMSLFCALSIFTVVPSYYEWFRFTHLILPNLNQTFIHFSSLLTTLSQELLFMDRYQSVNNNLHNLLRDNFKNFFNFIIIILILNEMKIISLAFSVNHYYLALLTALNFHEEITPLLAIFYQSSLYTFKSIIKLLLNENYSLYELCNELFISVHKILQTLTISVDSILLKLTFYTHLILETSFAYIGTQKIYTLILGSISEWIMDINSVSNFKADLPKCKPPFNLDNSLLTISFFVSAYCILTGQILAGLIITSTVWLKTHNIAFNKLPDIVYSQIKYMVYNMTYVFCSVASLLQGYNTATELQALSSFKNNLFIYFASYSTYIIEVSVFNDLSSDFFEKFTTKKSTYFDSSKDEPSHSHNHNPPFSFSTAYSIYFKM